jgi:hypothetical protein
MAPIILDVVDGRVHSVSRYKNAADGAFIDHLKNVIQDLFEIQSAIHGFLGPETQQHLIRKVYTFCQPTPSHHC